MKGRERKEERGRDGVFNLLSTGEQGEEGEEERAGRSRKKIWTLATEVKDKQ